MVNINLYLVIIKLNIIEINLQKPYIYYKYYKYLNIIKYILQIISYK